MSRWTESWRDFVRETSYKQILAGEKISEDQFWRSYAVYDRILSYSGYPGEILQKISSVIPAKSTFLDIGAGTGAFALPLSRKTKRTVAVDPSAYQLGVLQEKAKQEGLSNITILQKAWADIVPGELGEIRCENCDMGGNGLDKSPIGGTGEVDYSLASYSMFDEDIVGFLQKMIDVSKKEFSSYFGREIPSRSASLPTAPSLLRIIPACSIFWRRWDTFSGRIYLTGATLCRSIWRCANTDIRLRRRRN